MANYRLSKKALGDLERIYVRGIATFGLVQADCREARPVGYTDYRRFDALI